MQNILELRKHFITKFLFDGKKYNSFKILNNIYYYLTLQNKNTLNLFQNFFLIIEPLFYTEKIVYMSRLTQYIAFLSKKRRIRVILTILHDATKHTQKTRNLILSKILSNEIYTSFKKKSTTLNLCKTQNLNYLKLRNSTNYKWF